MSVDSCTLLPAKGHIRQRMIQDFFVLAKPRISVMVLFTVAVAGVISWNESGQALSLANAMIGLFLISASGCAVNQYLERFVDWSMPRTADRPLPGQRLTSLQVALFGSVTLGVGLAWMWKLVNWQSAVLAALSWVLYVCIYTPMKPRTWLNTFVGAVAGALPVLVGSTAVAQGQITFDAWMLFTVLYIWQFPHFMAIAWIYREDYRLGKLRMASTESNAERLTGWVAILFAVALFPATLISLWPTSVGQGSFCFIALALAGWYLILSIRFARTVNDENARCLFRVSLVYLPLYLLALTTSALIPGL
jgi:heme o synthase